MHRPTNREIASERRMMRPDYATAECDDAIPFLLRHETAMKRIFADDRELDGPPDVLLSQSLQAELYYLELEPDEDYDSSFSYV